MQWLHYVKNTAKLMRDGLWISTALTPDLLLKLEQFRTSYSFCLFAIRFRLFGCFGQSYPWSVIRVPKFSYPLNPGVDDAYNQTTVVANSIAHPCLVNRWCELELLLAFEGNKTRSESLQSEHQPLQTWRKWIDFSTIFTYFDRIIIVLLF